MQSLVEERAWEREEALVDEQPERPARRQPAGVAQVRSPLRLARWQEVSVDDEDRELVRALAVGHDPFPASLRAPAMVMGANYVDDSVFEETTGSIEEDLAAGRIRLVRAGEIVTKSGRGSVEKKDKSQRGVHNLTGVNEWIAVIPALSFQTVDVARARVQRGWFGAKLDIRRAYRSVPVSSHASMFLGFRWPNRCVCRPGFVPRAGVRRCEQACPVCGWSTFVELCLPFGLASAPEFFDRISRFIQRWWERTLSVEHSACFLVVYLDDFFIGGPCERMVLAEIERLSSMIESLGFEENRAKRCAPSQVISFLGVELNMRDMTVSIPSSKLAELLARIAAIEAKQLAGVDELASLAGLCSWCARIVYGARIFSRRLIDELTRLRALRLREAELPRELREDFVWWRQFAGQFNLQPIAPLAMIKDSCFFATDACLDARGAGIGGWYLVGETLHSFSFGPVVAALPHVDALGREQRDSLRIHHFELLAVLVAAESFGSMWRGKHIRLFCDNSIVVSWVTRGACRDAVGLGWLRALFWLSVRYAFRLTAVQIRSESNSLADALSRGESERFADLLGRWLARHRGASRDEQAESLLASDL